MAQNAPGRYYRSGISLIEPMDRFPTDRSAEDWFAQVRWPDGVRCPSCDSDNIYSRREKKRRNQPYRCRSCRKDFSVKTGTLMQSSNIGYRKWAIANYLLNTNLKGVSSMKLHRDLGISQKTAWMLMHKIRETFEDEAPGLFGGLERNKHKDRKIQQGRGTVGKPAVIGMKERDSKKVRAQVIDDTKRSTLHGFIHENAEEGSVVNTDDFRSYEKLQGYDHRSVKHSVGEYVDEQIHINGMESFWSLFEAGLQGYFPQD